MHAEKKKDGDKIKPNKTEQIRRTLNPDEMDKLDGDVIADYTVGRDNKREIVMFTEEFEVIIACLVKVTEVLAPGSKNAKSASWRGVTSFLYY